MSNITPGILLSFTSNGEERVSPLLAKRENSTEVKQGAIDENEIRRPEILLSFGSDYKVTN